MPHTVNVKYLNYCDYLRLINYSLCWNVLLGEVLDRVLLLLDQAKIWLHYFR